VAEDEELLVALVPVPLRVYVGVVLRVDVLPDEERVVVPLLLVVFVDGRVVV
jgi:hypothetical protein